MSSADNKTEEKAENSGKKASGHKPLPADNETHPTNPNPTPHPTNPQNKRTPARLAVISDSIAIFVAFSASFLIRFLEPSGTRAYLPFAFAVTLIIVGIWVTTLAVAGAYRWSTVANGITDTSAVIRASIYAFAATATLSYIFKAEVSRLFLFIAFPLGTLLLVLGRRFIRMYLYKTRNRNPITTPVILVKLENRTSEISKVLADSDELVFDRIITLDVSEELIAIGNFTQKITDAVNQQTAGRVVLDQGLNLANDQIAELSWELDQLDVELLVVPEFLGTWVAKLELETHTSLPLVSVVEPRLSDIQRVQKRILDLSIAVPALVILTPLLFIVSTLVATTSSGPILFKRLMVGVDGEQFNILKFRSMVKNAEKDERDVLGDPDKITIDKYKKDHRITTFGKIIRRTSIDELPQLWNVIRGDMSIVGPRPMNTDEIAAAPEYGNRRLLALPGITGMWQVSGRKETGWEERFQLDLRYVSNWSLSLDLAIIAKTVKVIATGNQGSV